MNVTFPRMDEHPAVRAACAALADLSQKYAPLSRRLATAEKRLGELRALTERRADEANEANMRSRVRTYTTVGTKDFLVGWPKQPDQVLGESFPVAVPKPPEAPEAPAADEHTPMMLALREAETKRALIRNRNAIRADFTAALDWPADLGEEETLELTLTVLREALAPYDQQFNEAVKACDAAELAAAESIAGLLRERMPVGKLAEATLLLAQALYEEEKLIQQAHAAGYCNGWNWPHLRAPGCLTLKELKNPLRSYADQGIIPQADVDAIFPPEPKPEQPGVIARMTKRLANALAGE